MSSFNPADFSPSQAVNDDFLNAEDNRAMFALWTLRLFNHPMYFDQLLKAAQGKKEVRVTTVGSVLGLNMTLNQQWEIEDYLYAMKEPARKVLHRLELAKPKFNDSIGANIYALQEVLSLTDPEMMMLGMAGLTRSLSSENYIEFANYFGDQTNKQACQMFAVMLGVTVNEVESMLSVHATLSKSGLLCLDFSPIIPLPLKLDLMEGLSGVLSDHFDSPLDLLSRYFTVSDTPRLTMDDFSYLTKQSQTIMNYIKNRPQKEGVNILIYGAPGTGKTQWVKALANEMGLPIYEINSSSEQNLSLQPAERFGAYGLAQSVLGSNEQALLLFDEIEDVFPENALFTVDSQQSSKAWINNLLETNPVPTFWLSNSVQQVDPAFIRRFDVVVQVETPPKTIRLKILNQLLDGLAVRPEWLEVLSKQTMLVPAVIERVAKVVRTQKHLSQSQEVESLFLELINSTLEAQGGEPIRLQNHESKLRYALEYVNTDADMPSLVTGLKAKQQARLCLYGIPGAGKTAFGHYVAEQLAKPLLVKKASDLISPYVGETEKNIAAAFKQASKDGAVLQIDEADSFLQARENATANWHVTQVNEMLTQMEAFEGVFIASTNLMGKIDSAAMRRFDVKLEFKPLLPEQAWNMFKTLFAEKGVNVSRMSQIKTELASLSVLTPGDFAAVKRRFSLGFQKFEPAYVLEALQEECRFKPNYSPSKGIGFLSNLK